MEIKNTLKHTRELNNKADTLLKEYLKNNDITKVNAIATDSDILNWGKSKFTTLKNPTFQKVFTSDILTTACSLVGAPNTFWNEMARRRDQKAAHEFLRKKITQEELKQILSGTGYSFKNELIDE